MQNHQFVDIQLKALQRFYNERQDVGGVEDVKNLNQIEQDLRNRTPFFNQNIVPALKEYIQYLEYKLVHAETEHNTLEASQIKHQIHDVHNVIRDFNKPGEAYDMNIFEFVEQVKSDHHETWDVKDVQEASKQNGHLSYQFIGYHVFPHDNPAQGFQVFTDGRIQLYTIASQVPGKFVIEFLNQPPANWFVRPNQ